ncbi:MAG: hypothetical protein NZ930_02035 [Candidatus Bipolaricaulota bacterium]|nr:hypothetical protein [Candidatus Bipolaricaulota bacterium]MDW8030927.1 hypothetical protein [Candidatus Bipolaricaulota bacterium]
MELKQQRKRWPWGLVFVGIIFAIFMVFQVRAWIEKPRQTKPITYLFDQPVTVRLETNEDWLRGVVWIKPRLWTQSAAFSPDGQFIAVPMGFGMIGILRAQDGSLVRMMAARKSRIEWVAFSPDGRFLASRDDEEIQLWSIADGKTEIVKRFPCKIYHPWGEQAVFSPDGRLLAAGCETTVKIWELETDHVSTIPAGGQPTLFSSSVAFSDDGQLIASSDFRDGTIRVWRARDGTELFAIKEQKTFGPVNLSLRGSLLASATPEGVIKLWRLPEGSLVRTISAHRKAKLTPVVLFSPSGDMLASSSGETIKLWSPEGRFLGRLDWQAGWPLAFSPDGKYLLSGGTTLKLWQLSDRSLKLNLGGIHPLWTVGEGVEALAFSADGSLLASSFSDNSEEGVKLWRMPKGRLEGILPTRGHALAFSPDGQLLAVVEPQAVTLWRIADGKRVRSHSCRVTSFTGYLVAFSPDGALLAAACEHQIIAWNVSDGSQFFSARSWRVGGIAFSPDGQLLAVNGTGVKLYSARDGKEVRTLLQASYCLGSCAVAFSTDGQLVAASPDGDSITVWRVSNGQEVRSYVTQSEYWSDIQALAFVPSSKIVAIAEGEVIKLWDVENDQWVGILQGHGGSIDSRIKTLAASPDGKYLASGGSDGLALWQIQNR